MIGTEFIKGQGLGNQLLAYVSARAIAKSYGFDFGCAGLDRLGINIHSIDGVNFLDLDTGYEIPDEEIANFKRYDEKEERIFVGNSVHDITKGCYIAGADEKLVKVTVSDDAHIPDGALSDNTLLYGNLQAEEYFAPYMDELQKWLKVKPEFDSKEFTKDNLCIINMRGGEYTDSPELFLEKKYWINGMKHMRKLRPDMEFVIITEDVETAHKILPGIPAYHFSVGKDYVTIKNATYLLLSNSSFAVLPAMTSETCKYILAPKYWARHNVSNGYWASEQNIYTGWNYMDRKGRVFSAEECRKELSAWKKKVGMAGDGNLVNVSSELEIPAGMGASFGWKIPARGIRKSLQLLRAKSIRTIYYGKRAVRSLTRRLFCK